MIFVETHIADLKIIRSERAEDRRGFFSETYRSDLFVENGIFETFVQDNHSRSTNAGTLRGVVAIFDLS
jgi:dTDP-4-dehydrorhamnose 3,5-epimerase